MVPYDRVKSCLNIPYICDTTISCENISIQHNHTLTSMTKYELTDHILMAVGMLS